jgi:hypothetical protein
VFLKKEDE